MEARYRWLSAAILFTEMLISYKYRKGTGHLTDDPTPIYIWLPWSAGLIALTAGWFYLRFKPDHTVKYPGYQSSWRLNLLPDYATTNQQVDDVTFGGNLI